jgi:hypothetical protein
MSHPSHPLLDQLNQVEEDMKRFVSPGQGGPDIVGEPASDPTIGSWVRAFVYRIIQAQTRTASGAIYNDLKCPICLEFFTQNTTYAGTDRDAITVPCGHTGCRGCFRDWYRRGNSTCPTCRTVGVVTDRTVNGPKSITITDIVNRLKPRGTVGGRKHKNRMTRKQK